MGKIKQKKILKITKEKTKNNYRKKVLFIHKYPFLPTLSAIFFFCRQFPFTFVRWQYFKE